jgi:hypothetical protein
MDKFSNKWIMYYEIHRQSRLGFTPSQIANYMGIDARTAKKLLAMTEKEYQEHLESLSQRSKKLLDYEDFVKMRIEQCRQASSAQVQDWLKECHNDFMAVNQKTIYNFVQYVRCKYNLPKTFDVRQYCKVEELPYGKQVQADLGEFNMTDAEGNRKKVYFFAMVLARSRYKFVYFTERPFTSDAVIDAHEKAFDFFGGYPKEVVYDQDKILLTAENAGNLVLTEAFRAYQQERPFQLHFCRKNDPQSKGKIENVIKYIKYNFLRGRTFFDINTLNCQAVQWLERTANTKVHDTTHKIPYEEWMIERSQLLTLKPPFSIKPEAISFGVRKDNTIKFRGNYYSLPVGTYKGPETTVLVQQEDGNLIIRDGKFAEIARHEISLLKGIQVRNNNHYRDHSNDIDELIQNVSKMFTDQPKAKEYLEKIRQKSPRYIRDQARIIANVCTRCDQQDIDKTLQYCIENAIYTATDFEPVLKSIGNQKQESGSKKSAKSILKKKYKIIPQTSNISDYSQILH